MSFIVQKALTKVSGSYITGYIPLKCLGTALGEV
jgi:hypothetical protein